MENKKMSVDDYNSLIKLICKLDKVKRQELVSRLKEQLSNEFLNDMNEFTYNRLNNFCSKYIEDGSPVILMKGKRFVYFPNDYKYEDHDFYDKTGRFKTE